MKFLLRQFNYKVHISIFLFILSIIFVTSVFGEVHSSTYDLDCGLNCSPKKSIRSSAGILYAYTTLLFNENHHFVNQIKPNTIPNDENNKDEYNILWYNKYLKTIKNNEIKSIAQDSLNLYINPSSFNTKQVRLLENRFSKKHIIIKFAKFKIENKINISLDYCIFGSKSQVKLKHPFLISKMKIYNIRPFTTYDDLSTSNTTFYSNMMYINSDEVNNDSLIAIGVISGKIDHSQYFVGSKITEDIKYCLKKSVFKPSETRKTFWRMFTIHELTHKILKNKFLLDIPDQVTEEELSLSSTIYDNPYLGLSVLYAYLGYNSINPHKIAAENYIKYFSNHLKKPELTKNPSLIKFLPAKVLQKITKKHFIEIYNDLKARSKINNNSHKYSDY